MLTIGTYAMIARFASPVFGRTRWYKALMVGVLAWLLIPVAFATLNNVPALRYFNANIPAVASLGVYVLVGGIVIAVTRRVTRHLREDDAPRGTQCVSRTAAHSPQAQPTEQAPAQFTQEPVLEYPTLQRAPIFH